ncbi:DUF4738 domain-containing protein [Flavobacterium cerinum]|uniref:DUF4738 domain-containing protein n=1 Tax=Flavobacterium cerinum TaxID=2502784 RepID=A0ABY5ITC9_9FLAO|nr:DUF4738 domain-containing protein [Flavobacterium cerinum]UUC44721.1 DUF4738 domain-containing protein [Flavobacterium cerinum]
MKIHPLIPILLINTLFFLSSCTKSKSENENRNVAKEKEIKNNTVKTDTIRRNQYVTYNITEDTIVGNYEIRINNKNTEEYVRQNIRISDSIVVQSFYPEMESKITIKKNGVPFFNKTFRKTDLPEGTFYDLLRSAIMKDFVFNRMEEGTDTLIFKTTLLIPNTDFENDFYLKVNKNGSFKLEWIDYESED